MGEHEGLSQPCGSLLPNGLLPVNAGNVTRVLDTERWSKVEGRVAELIACIQPNRPSEESRNAVASYVEKLVMRCFSCEVFTFGSVPLKTYLPDGDIDLTAFIKNEDLKDTWANEVREVLEKEERCENAEFRVKEVQYIQAEVKIIKCLVENIVVDISFNQVGGLCTLCFLEEIDHLIGQNHLFKRSIILIKAWCYYESRILGAHHGLISTYALETLVLYIFHVFNNTFAGPLEVLYRFLAFFSNFDWDNFCVSLSGPVPISSLPDMMAEPPRKDAGELLLSKLFLDACSTVYAVFPGGQENQGQQFVSKHFNVIDPLRTNNNLGRSVSRGNFYRIRSAFAFGAKRLANLLDCPNENLIAEINRFFMNTWKRHGSGKRPDAPLLSINCVQNLSNGLAEGPNNHSLANPKKKSGNVGLLVAQEHQPEGEHSSHEYASQIVYNVTQPAQIAYRTSSSMSGQKDLLNDINFQEIDPFERHTSCSISAQPEKNKRNERLDYSVTNQEGQSKFQFARTRSSPELTGTSANFTSRMKHARPVEGAKMHNGHSMSEYTSRRKNIGPEFLDDQGARIVVDDPSLRPSLRHQSLEIVTNSNNISSSFIDDSGFTAMGEEQASVSEALELQQQEEQDLINMMASPWIHNFDGQVQLPMHFSYPHCPLPLSPVLASMSCAQRNLGGILQTNTTLIEPSWGSGVHFPQGFVSSPIPNYIANPSLNPSSEEADSFNENSVLSDLSSENRDSGKWHDNVDGSIGGFETENGGPQMLHSEEIKHSPASSYNHMLPTSISTTSVLRGNVKMAAESRGSSGDFPDVFRHQTRTASDMNVSDRNAGLSFFPVIQAGPSRSKFSSETSRYAENSKLSKLAREWGRKPSVPAVATSKMSGWQFEGASGHAFSAEKGDNKWDRASISTSGVNNADHSFLAATLASPHASQLSGHEPAQFNGADSVIPIAPMLFGNSCKRVIDNSWVLPFAFYPTGPPVPFLTMLPIYNFPTDGANADGLVNPMEEDSREAPQTSMPERNIDIEDKHNQSDGQLNNFDLSSSNVSVSETSEEHKLDILNSDFASHWQNLQYGRLCQNNQSHRSIIYSPPVMVPPAYLQGHFLLDGHGRPPAANVNFLTQIMGFGPRLVPGTSVQPRPNRPSGVFSKYGDELPKYRSGTGTYLPNPKASFRERHFSSTRNHRGGFSRNHVDQADREGNRTNSKSRSASRNRGRNQFEKLGVRADRCTASDGRAERVRDTYTHDQISSLQAQTTFESSAASLSSTTLAYGMYSIPVVTSNGFGTGPTVPFGVMLYPYEQRVGYGSSAESMEFGSLGPLHLSS